MDEPQLTITDRPEANRYEAHLAGELAGFVEYRVVRTRRILLHTEVPSAFGGRGVGAALARHVLEDARASGILVTVKCPFIQAYLQRHPEYADAVAPALVPRSREA
jgi:predicted GNAT family acetyltransferase